MDVLARLLDSLSSWRQQLRGALAQALPDAIGQTLADHEYRLRRLEVAAGIGQEAAAPADHPRATFDPAPHAAPL